MLLRQAGLNATCGLFKALQYLLYITRPVDMCIHCIYMYNVHVHMYIHVHVKLHEFTDT